MKPLSQGAFVRRAAAAALSVLILASCGRQKKADAPAAPPAAESIADLFSSMRMRGLAERADIPSIELESIAGKASTLADHRGKVVLLNFWATWCPPCRAEMPSLQALYGKLRDSGIAFDFIAIDVQEDRATVEKFIKDNGYSFPVYLDESGAVSSRFVSQGIPTTFIIDKKGKVAGYVVGSIEWDRPEALRLFAALSAE